MSPSERVLINVTITFLRVDTPGEEQGLASDSSVRGTIAAEDGVSIPFSGWLDLMGELERLTESARPSATGPARVQ
jgi:hypothetical protein